MPSEVKVANKTGELDHVENDVGIIYDTAKGIDLVVCFMSQDLNDTSAAQNTIAQDSHKRSMDTITNNKITDLLDRTKRMMRHRNASSFFSSFLLPLHRIFPKSPENTRQRTVCQQAHQKKALIWIHYVDLTHFAAGQDLLDLLQKMTVSRIRIILPSPERSQKTPA